MGEVLEDVLSGLKQRKAEETAAGESRLEQVLVRKGSKPRKCKGKCLDVAKKAVNVGKDEILSKGQDDNRDNELDQDDGSVLYFFNQLALEYQYEGQIDFQGMWDGIVYWWRKANLHKARAHDQLDWI